MQNLLFLLLILCGLYWLFQKFVATTTLTMNNLGLPQTSAQLRDRPVVVQITRNGYSPQRVVIDPGTAVVWKNVDQERHTVTSIYDPIRLQSPALAPGETYSILFNRPGKHPYRCRRHPFTKGLIHVRGDPRENIYW